MYKYISGGTVLKMAIRFSISMPWVEDTVSLMLQGDHAPVAFQHIELTHSEFE
ncbi:MAG: hypothetical protein VCD00_01540 [Candidatus Hydrogenedentota bacterium]